MHHKLFAGALFSAILLAACGDDTSGGGAGTGGSGASTTAQTSTDTGSGTSTGAGSGGAGGTGSGTTAGTGAGTGSGGDDANTVTITLDSFEVLPGEEVYKCQNFANPFGQDAHIQAFESHMTSGSHHLLLFYREGATDGELTDCSGLEFAATPYSTQLPDDSLTFPAGVAAALPGNMGIRLQSHYLNVTPDPITAHVEVKLHRAVDGTVEDVAGVLFVVQPAIHVEPHSTKTVTYDCTIPADMNVMKASSHMHKHGTSFASTVDGETFYDTTTWDEPEPSLYDPPMLLSEGAPLHFECTYQNDSNETLTFGESAESNEMCILVASYYPAVDGLPTIDCQ